MKTNFILTILATGFMYSCNPTEKNTQNEEMDSTEVMEEVASIEPVDNILTEEEKLEEWKLLFDGKTLEGWRNYNSESLTDKWIIDDASIHMTGEDGKDLVLPGGEYENFELRLDWKVIKGGNSGLIFNVKEMPELEHPYDTGPEMQILDNDNHPDGKIVKHRAGDLYDMISCSEETVNPGGEWNSVRLISNNGKVEHWLNGVKVVEYEMFTEKWWEMISNSKFKDWEHFGKAKSGLIVLQDHSDKVWFKNIKIKRL